MKCVAAKRAVYFKIYRITTLPCVTTHCAWIHLEELTIISLTSDYSGACMFKQHFNLKVSEGITSILVLKFTMLSIIPVIWTFVAVTVGTNTNTWIPHPTSPSEVARGNTTEPSETFTMRFNISQYQKILNGENETEGQSTISRIFIELVQTCTVHFHGAYGYVDEYNRDINWIDLRFFNICATFPHANCVQISTNNESIFRRLSNSPDQFNEKTRSPPGPTPNDWRMSGHLKKAESLSLINHKFFPQPTKFRETCLILVDTSHEPYCIPHRFSMAFSGKFSPNFIFLYKTFYGGQCSYQGIPLQYRASYYRYCGPNHEQTPTFSEDEGASIILTYSKHPDVIRMEGFDRDTINILHLPKNVTVSQLSMHWELTRRDIQVEYFCVPQRNSSEMPAKELSVVTNISQKICGETPLVNIYKRNTRHSPESIFMRIWDPHEHCVYETILQKYFRSNDSLKSHAKIVWPIALEFGEAWTDNRPRIDGRGKTGKFYTPYGARMQGYRYAIFIDRDSLKSDFDMRSLLQPFDWLTWVHLVGSMIAMTIAFRFLSKSFSATWLISVLMEQGGQVRQCRKSHANTFLALIWVYASILLRFSYTTNMYSAITADKVIPIPRNFSELVKHPFNEIFNMFVPHEQSQRLLQWKGKDLFNLSEQVLWDSVTPIMHEDLLQLIKKREGNKLISLFENSQGEIKMSRPRPRIAFLSYTHPNKLVYDEKWEEYDWRYVKQKLWEEPFPFRTLLSKVGGRVMIPGKDSQIRNRLWLYHGKRNYFTDRFVRDLSGLVESGIYGRWEYLTRKYSEAMYLEKLEIDKGKYRNNLTGNFFTAAGSPMLDNVGKCYQPANNYTILVIWVVYWTCLIISVFGYLKEIVRLNLPGRCLNSCTCHVQKYKEE